MAATATSNHFNLHLSGVGYLNRIRWVEPSQKKATGRRAEAFLCCVINALHGDSGKPDSTYLDLRVSGREAMQMVERLQGDVEQGKKVFVSFRVGDIYPHTYEREVRDSSGRKTGQREWSSIIKGRLLALTSITIDGANVYKRESISPATEEASSHDDSDEGNQQVHARPQSRPVERQRNTAYQAGYAAGRTVRQGSQRLSQALA